MSSRITSHSPSNSSHATPTLSAARTRIKSRAQRRRLARKKASSSPLVHNASSINTDQTTSNLCDSMSAELTAETYECSICMSVIRRHHAIHTCRQCFAAFHLQCAQQWAKQLHNDEGWRCPTCQYVSYNAPKHYQCFCGKTIKPGRSHTLQSHPHACAQVCGRIRHHNCPHQCVIQCHPGPCPPCRATTTTYCGCGRSQIQVPCMSKSSRISCGEICRKLLSCKRHTCQHECHNEECEPCNRLLKLSCFCGKLVNVERVCSATATLSIDVGTPQWRFSCRQRCERSLDCHDESHRCHRECHPDQCQNCPRMPSTNQLCACGNNTFPEVIRTTCSMPLPTCGNVCGRARTSCVHVCKQLCHDSDCLPCDENIVTPCRCGSNTLTLTCQLYHQAMNEETDASSRNVLLCNKRCNHVLRCGKHRCLNTCCVDAIHRCSVLCSKVLNCGLHTCDRECHYGIECEPCGRPLLNGVSCVCGRSTIHGPLLCGTSPPLCQYRCTLSRQCRHQCLYECHAPPCPPCMILVSRQCAGQHQILNNVPCSTRNLGCGKQCRRRTSCKNNDHLCTKLCHEHTIDTPCDEVCGRIRQCRHQCKQSCHNDTLCNEFPCRDFIQISCKCGTKTRNIRCNRGDVSTQASSSSSSSLPSLTMLQCDASCELAQRNARLRSALRVSSVLKSSIHTHSNDDDDSQQVYLPWTVSCVQYAMKYIHVVRKFEALFSVIIDGAQDSYSFEPMCLDQRHLIISMASAYHMWSDMLDHGRNRSVRVLRTHQTASLPSILLLSYVANVYKSRSHCMVFKTAQITTETLGVVLYGVQVGRGNGRDLLHQCVENWTSTRRSRLHWLNEHDVLFVCTTKTIMNICLHEIDINGPVFHHIESANHHHMNLMSITNFFKNSQRLKSSSLSSTSHSNINGDSWRNQSSSSSLSSSREMTNTESKSNTTNSFSALTIEDEIVDDWEQL